MTSILYVLCVTVPQQLISRRKGLMKYLRRTNFDMYRQVVLDLHLEREALAIPL